MAPLNINIRPFLPSDFPAAATVVAAAMQDDELFVFLCPYRNANPESFRQYHLRSLQKRYYSGDQMIRVAEVESLDTISPNDAMERKTIVGLVIYSRRGVSDNVKLLMKKQSWLDFLGRHLLSLERRYADLFQLDKSVSRINVARFEAALEDIEDPFSNFPERWHLHVLAVDPQYQRQGIGSKLVQGVLELAQSENVPITLNASQKGQLLYRQMGFKDVRVDRVAEGVEGMAMIRMPVPVEWETAL